MEKKIINSYPAECWNDTTPLGNGTLGASVYGCVYDERILINHEATLSLYYQHLGLVPLDLLMIY